MRPSSVNLPGLHKRLPLDAPQLHDTAKLRAFELMAAKRGNAALERIFNETETLLPKLIASVRWSVLHLPIKDFAESADMSQNGYVAMEKDLGGKLAPHRSKYTRILEYWEECGIPLGIREQLLDLLTVPDLLEKAPEARNLGEVIEHVRTRYSECLSAKHMNAFYHRIGFDRGHANVEALQPQFYNTIWQREKTKTIPACVEVLGIVDGMYPTKDEKGAAFNALRREEGLAVWTATKERQYEDWTLEKPLASMLIAMERDLAVTHGVTCTAQSLQEAYGFGPLHAQQLIQKELIAPEAIEPLVKELLPPREREAFRNAWKQAWEAECARPSFGTLATQAMDAQGFTTPQLAKLAGIKTPEERGVAKTDERKQRYRPDSEIRGILYHNHVSRQVAVEALVQVLAENPEDADALRQAYVAERERFFRRNGSGLKGKGLDMRIRRELANASLEEVARALLPKNDSPPAVKDARKFVQHLEWMTKEENETFTYRRIVGFLNKKAAAEGKAAKDRVLSLHEVAEHLKEFSTVQQMCQNLIVAMKGAKFVSECMRNIARSNEEWLRADLIIKASQGEFMPPLPSLRIMLKSTLDLPLPEPVVRDWHEHFPAALAGRVPEFPTVSRPLARVITTLIANKESSAMGFFEDRVPGVVPTQGTKVLRDLDAGEPVDWRHLHKILLGAGFMPGTLPYKLAKLLHENGGDVDAAIKELKPQLEAQKKEIHPTNLPGLTLQELKKHKPKA